MKGSFKGLSLVLLCLLVFAPRALAHKVTLFAWAEGGTVYTQSKFSGGKMVKDGKVEVFDGDGTLLLEGRTNDNGEFSFKVPTITDLNLVLTAGIGHQNTWTLSAAELGEGALDPVVTLPAPSAPPVSEPRQETGPWADDPGLTAQAVEAIVARQLKQKLQPLTRMIAAAQDKGPTVSDIFGGIGYIIGLVGLGAYVRCRRDSRRS